jgi:hypothetical protein
MGFELGPKPLRRPPKGWLPARAFALRQSVSDTPSEPASETVIDTVFVLDVTWRVEIEGREAYELQEKRFCPTWLITGPLGAGNRWYKVRIRPQYGLMADVAMPCHVDPGDPTQLWIDWDGAYEAHVPAWEREARVRREVASRANTYERVVERVINPFAGKVREVEEEEVERRIQAEAERLEEQRAKYAPPPDPVGDAESAELMRRMRELERIQREGGKVRATVVAREDTRRTFAKVPVTLLTFELDDGRRIVFEHVFGPRHAKRYKVGAQIDAWIDPSDPDAICPGR